MVPTNEGPSKTVQQRPVLGKAQRLRHPELEVDLGTRIRNLRQESISETSEVGKESRLLAQGAQHIISLILQVTQLQNWI